MLETLARTVLSGTAVSFRLVRPIFGGLPFNRSMAPAASST